MLPPGGPLISSMRLHGRLVERSRPRRIPRLSYRRRTPFTTYCTLVAGNASNNGLPAERVDHSHEARWLCLSGTHSHTPIPVLRISLRRRVRKDTMSLPEGLGTPTSFLHPYPMPTRLRTLRHCRCRLLEGESAPNQRHTRDLPVPVYCRQHPSIGPPSWMVASLSHWRGEERGSRVCSRNLLRASSSTFVRVSITTLKLIFCPFEKSSFLRCS